MHQPFPQTMAELLAQFPRDGVVEWIGVRPARRTPMNALDTVTIMAHGLDGDHRTKPGKRAVTLIQAEHLPAIANLADRDAVDPASLRRNIVVSGINLLALKDRIFQIGTATLRGTGPCAPCSRMEETLGTGGYNAMRGHGGITAEVVEPGSIRLADVVRAL
ncbi:MAG: MOSC domain-containing protein [Ahrensia sp.]